MPEFSLLTFDCYGTLIDWERGMKNALEGLVKKHNFNLDMKSLPARYVEIELEVEQKGYRKYKEILTLGVRRIFEEKDIKLNSQEAGIFADTIRKWPPFEETSEVLKILKKEFKLAILSNIDDDLIQHSIRLIGVEFDGVITAEQVRSYKPSHGHWKKMMDHFDFQKKISSTSPQATFMISSLPRNWASKRHGSTERMKSLIGTIRLILSLET